MVSLETVHASLSHNVVVMLCWKLLLILSGVVADFIPFYWIDSVIFLARNSQAEHQWRIIRVIYLVVKKLVYYRSS